MREELRLYLRYVDILRPRYPVLALKLALDALVRGIDLLGTMLAKVLFDFAFPFRDPALFKLVLGASAAACLARFHFSLLSGYILSGISRSLGTREGVFRHIEDLPLKVTSQQGRGDLLVRVTKDVDQLWAVVLDLPQAAILSAFHFSAILFLCFSMDPAVSLLALAAIPVHAVQARFLSQRLVTARESHLQAQASVFEFLRQRLAQLFIIKASRQETSEFDRLRVMLDRSYDSGRKQEVVDALGSNAGALTSGLWLLMIAAFLGSRVLAGKLSSGEVVALLLLLGQIGGPVRGLASLYGKWRSGMVSIHRVEAILAGGGEQPDAGTPLVPAEGRIEFKDVSFSYDGRTPVLRGVSLVVAPRSMLAIVGHSGAGKSTLVSLLCRLYTADRGTISIDGQDVAKATLASVRADAVFVAQNYSLFSGTVRENIAYARPDAPASEVERVAREAACMEFIRELPQGLDTMMATGEELSPGQRQRIMLARALLLDPPIYIFDEATASLDPVTEYHFAQAMQAISKRKTVIAIAHRLSTIKNADKIVVLSHGELVEDGTFEDLMRRRGYFYHFYCRQFGGLAEFKKALDIEHERSVRYGSTYSLAAFVVTNYPGIAAEHGEPAAAKVLSELEMKFHRALRIGDGVAAFRDGALLLLLPELSGEKCRGFLARMSRTFADCSVQLGGSPVPVKLQGVVVRVSKGLAQGSSTEKMIASLLDEAARSDGGRFGRILDLSGDGRLQEFA